MKIKTIICIGDSFTQGYGVDLEDKWIANISIPETYFINCGINGDTTSGMLARFKYDIIEKHPDYVLITGGINDFIAGSCLDIPQNNYMAMIHQAAAARIFPIIGIAPSFIPENIRNDWAAFNDFNAVKSKQLQLRKWLIHFSKTFHLPVIDFYAGLEKYCNENQGINASLLYSDGMHFTKEGNNLISDIATQKFKKILKR